MKKILYFFIFICCTNSVLFANEINETNEKDNIHIAIKEDGITIGSIQNSGESRSNISQNIAKKGLTINGKPLEEKHEK